MKYRIIKNELDEVIIQKYISWPSVPDPRGLWVEIMQTCTIGEAEAYLNSRKEDAEKIKNTSEKRQQITVIKEDEF